jgi:hypothetical protein
MILGTEGAVHAVPGETARGLAPGNPAVLAVGPAVSAGVSIGHEERCNAR